MSVLAWKKLFRIANSEPSESRIPRSGNLVLKRVRLVGTGGPMQEENERYTGPFCFNRGLR